MAHHTIILFPAVALLLLRHYYVAAAPAPVIGMPGCDTSCGNISVPYPFGIGPPYCYHSPGFNLTCNRSSNPPRLLLGDGTFQVVEDIDIIYPSLDVIYTGDIKTNSRGRGRLGGGLRDDGPYTLSMGNQLVLVGCNMRAMLRSGNVTMSSCSSFCYDGKTPYYEHALSDLEENSMLCSGFGCCKAPIVVNREILAGSGQLVPITSYDVELASFGWNRSEATEWQPHVFVAASGWFSQLSISHHLLSKNNQIAASTTVRLWLNWEIIDAQGKVMPSSQWDQCLSDVAQRVCISNNSRCKRGDRGGFRCYCKDGYQSGSPYITNGCRDINECELPELYPCFGQCTNTDGSYLCVCLPGTRGDPSKFGGCFSSLTGDCNTSCGNVGVPYPFGLGPPNCYLPGFDLTCDTSHQPPRLKLGIFQVVDIFLRNNTVRVINTELLFDANGGAGSEYADPFMSMGSGDEAPYSLSTSNELILIGCRVQAELSGDSGILSGCSSSCSQNENGTYKDIVAAPTSKNDDQYCYGTGCCQARIAMSMDGMPSLFRIDSIDHNNDWDEALPHSYGLIAEEGWFSKSHVSALLRQRQSTTPFFIPMGMEVPIVLEWEVLQLQPRASTRQPTTASSQKYVKCPGICMGKNSLCKQRIRGYSCQCREGYDGNPYADGCKGGRKIFKGTNAIIGVASGFGIVLLFFGSFFMSKKLKYRRAQIMKKKFFQQNRGKLLQHLVSQRADISERMIIPIEELEKATNNFDKARELGGGGHGTVYKGILSDLHVVAIKKPKKVFQEEIEEFINEVAILSQINHRNVVKLYGCCLETEVPMLVYEFISNGTLHEHLHVEGEKSLSSWDDRQRIALETAKSIAYLHSTASNPVIHRDIKSVNILLDDTLTAKVADFGASRYVPIDKSGVTTRVQGTIGYMDPMYYYTGRLTEKSDVFGFGVVLVELLTRQRPFLYLSSEGDGLVAHFSTLFAEGNMLQILDPQVIEEGDKEVEEVASLAVSCIKYAGADRPTMRQVELVLESIQSSKQLRNVIAPNSEEVGTTRNCSWINGTGTSKECTRQYSMEHEFEMSARYPR